MDERVIKVITDLTACTPAVRNITTAASAAEKAAVSAAAFYDADLVPLSHARIVRAERLLSALRQDVADLDRKLQVLRVELSAAVAQPMHRIGAWNVLPDTWWHTRVMRMDELLTAVVRARAHLAQALPDRHADHAVDAHGCDSYRQLVGCVCECVAEMSRRWASLVTFVDEWKDIAIVMVDGIGESGSLLPA